MTFNRGPNSLDDTGMIWVGEMHDIQLLFVCARPPWQGQNNQQDDCGH